VAIMPMPRPRSWNVVFVAAGASALIFDGLARANGGLSHWRLRSGGRHSLAACLATRAPLPALAGLAAGVILCDAAFDAGWAATGLVAFQLFTVARLGSFDVGSVAMRVPLAFATLAFGDTVRSRQALRAAAHKQEQRERSERDEAARRRAEDERLRIARELHDTLAHSLVAMNIRAGVALDLHDSQDPSGALQDVKQASATALRELRATLGLLRDQGEVVPTAAAFDLEALAGLIDNAGASGVRADMDVEVDNATAPSAAAEQRFRSSRRR
jgi:signal transduction histidine kinase